MYEIASELKPLMYVNMHSGMYALFMPYDHSTEMPNTQEAKDQFGMLQVLNHISCDGRCTIGNGGGSDKVG